MSRKVQSEISMSRKPRSEPEAGKLRNEIKMSQKLPNEVP